MILKNLKRKFRSEQYLGRMSSYTFDNGEEVVDDNLHNEHKVNGRPRIAAIVSDRLFKGLSYECDLILLTPDNFRRVLKYGDVDLLLIESTWLDVTGKWEARHYHSVANGNTKSALEEVADFAKRREVPSVFWMTLGKGYFNFFDRLAKIVNRFYYADVGVQKLCNRAGIEGAFLPPCYQPKLFNPFFRAKNRQKRGLGIIYDGYVEVEKNNSVRETLLSLSEDYAVQVIERDVDIFTNRVSSVGELSKVVCGSVDRPGLVNLLTGKKSLLLRMEVRSDDDIEDLWKNLEYMGMGLPVISLDEIDDHYNQPIVHVESYADLISEISRYYQSIDYYEKISHITWRETLKHTFEERLHSICLDLDLGCDESFSKPLASVVTPTVRPDRIQGILETFNQFNYEHKELIIVVNKDGSDVGTELNKMIKSKNVKIATLPSNKFAAEALNLGVSLSSGDYCFRVDDDDIYLPNYLGDCIAQARIMNLDLFGKQACPIYIAGETCLYERRKKSDKVMISAESLSNGNDQLGGNSISGKRSFFIDNPYPENLYGAADTALALSLKDPGLRIAKLDPYNIAAERRANDATHTWKPDLDRLKRSRKTIKNYENVAI